MLKISFVTFLYSIDVLSDPYHRVHHCGRGDKVHHCGRSNRVDRVYHCGRSHRVHRHLTLLPAGYEKGC